MVKRGKGPVHRLQAIIKGTLSRYGYGVSTITDFRNIKEQFDKINPDLILLDINLLYYDGFYFCRIFRRKSKAPIIIISAHTEDAHQVGMEMRPTTTS
jgi:Response regulators consisting of a CheY-like receiver domain and a winged-helix DNA-binding domain